MEQDADAVSKKTAEIQLGEDLDLLSVEELKERITCLEVEIDRFRQAIDAKLRVKDDAEAIFRT